MNTAMALPGVLAACALVFAGCSSAQDSSRAETEDLHLIGGGYPIYWCGGGVNGACSTGRTGGGEMDDAGPGDAGLQCRQDSDCVAVPAAGCCHNGWKTAVDRAEVATYEKVSACNRSRPICPMYIVDDTRVAECNGSTHACEMVNVDQIVCGGFIVHPHECPDGYECHLGRIPDVGGHCVAASRAGP
jgi:hypothetical protein